MSGQLFILLICSIPARLIVSHLIDCYLPLLYLPASLPTHPPAFHSFFGLVYLTINMNFASSFNRANIPNDCAFACVHACMCVCVIFVQVITFNQLSSSPSSFLSFPNVLHHSVHACLFVCPIACLLASVRPVHAHKYAGQINQHHHHYDQDHHHRSWSNCIPIKIDE